MESGQPLEPTRDYFPAWPFEKGTDEVGKPIVGAIGFLDTNRSGSYRLIYRTLGGKYVNAETQAVSSGMDTLNSLINTPWETVVNVDPVFPPTPHNVTLSNVAGTDAILQAVQVLSTVLASPDRNIMMEDILDLDTSLVEPIVTSMSSLADALRIIAESNTIYHNSANTGGLLRDMGISVAGEWRDIGLSLTVQYTGSYMLNVCGNPTVTDASGPLAYEFRYAVNGRIKPSSVLANDLLGLAARDTVSVQIRTVKTSSTRTIVSGDGISCGITLVRVSS